MSTESVGAQIKASRYEQRLTIRRAAEWAGIPAATWTRVEHGSMHLSPDNRVDYRVDHETLMKIAGVLGLSGSSLWEEL